MTPTPVALAIMLQHGIIVPTQSGAISWREYVLSGTETSHLGKR